MAIAPVTVTIPLVDFLGFVPDPRRTKVILTTNVDSGFLVDTTTGGSFRLADARVSIDTAGVATFSTLPSGAAGLNPSAYQIRVQIDAVNPVAGKRKVVDLGWYTITAAANLKDLVSAQYVPPTYLSGVTAELDGYVDSASAASTAAAASAASAAASAALAGNIANIDTPDALVEALVESPTSLTSAALSATFVTRPAQRVFLGDFMIGGATDTAALAAALAVTVNQTLDLQGRTLNLTGTTEVTNDGVTIDAEGATINIADDGTAAGCIIKVVGVSDFTWRGGTIAQSAASRTGVYGLLSLFDVTRYRVSNLDIIGGSSGGFMALHSTEGVVDSVRVRDTKADGFHFTRGCKNTQVSNCYAANTGDDMFAVVSVITDDDVLIYDPCERIAFVNPVGDYTTFGGGVAFIGALNCSVTGGHIFNTTDSALKFGTDDLAGTYRAIGNKATGIILDTISDPTKSVVRIGASDDTTLVNVDALNGPGPGIACLGGAVRATVLGGRVSGNADAGIYDDGSGNGGDVPANGNNFIGVELRGNSLPHVGSGTYTNCIPA